MSALSPFVLQRGTGPLLISLPHVGLAFREEKGAIYEPRARENEDADWFLDRLLSFASELGASTLIPTYSRYVIDLDRSTAERTAPESGHEALCPTRTRAGTPLYGAISTGAVGAHLVGARIDECWQPYHDALRAELERLRAEHGHAILLDAQSSRSEVPSLFRGLLPHLNLGTGGGTSCAPALATTIERSLTEQDVCGHVLDGHFLGGFATTTYGDPAADLHAVHLTVAWRTYLREGPPPRWDAERATQATDVLRPLVQAMLDWQPA